MWIRTLDAWKQSLHEGRKVTSSIARRLNWTWKRASGAMLITSFTTFVALILTANSPMPMVRAFGVFTGTMVLFNFVMVITFFPAIVGKLVSHTHESLRYPPHNNIQHCTWNVRAFGDPNYCVANRIVRCKAVLFCKKHRSDFVFSHLIN